MFAGTVKRRRMGGRDGNEGRESDEGVRRKNTKVEREKDRSRFLRTLF